MAVAVITGATSGIGYALAQRLAEKYQVVGCGREAERVALLRQQHPTWDLQVADLTQPSARTAFAQHILRTYSEIAVLIHNAGRYAPDNLLDEGAGTYEEMVETNLSSAYHLTRLLLGRFVAQRRGRIVFIGSVAAVQAYASGVAYSVAKAGLLALARNLRQILKEYGVGVTHLTLGATYTRSWMGTNLPRERFIPPEAVAELIWSLLHLPPSVVVEEVVVRPMAGDI
ncbi:MAG: SDR family oxidoreductase [Bacteroidia bacterium]|nr:SDR family oxidoreductase [Bacteroidia bacterium]MDW8089767.1 SDR family oxidoreductase [Bacteroidia bacterium]